ncbi:Phosphoenolpyruvate synthase [Fundidesulfovibrio magnetotacticus]|uniref:Phosphoenolpyruvate synthase n=1 Tax=Fundidesulfovibrio magnetotacticus TaxID=2730080 RepID=A0A6V8LN31_9BACT|nr:PEP/pyruvate-binding domain-containing protein [Fundidesulfovibrio magnetotacticus]GFK94072.1 Phosphoenolpyruvate synthase [Fundidesulfovibrio magnetotacticus]
MFTRLKTFFSSLIGGHHQGEGMSDEEILAEFKKRYHNFRLLLTANKKTLMIMSEMEQALRGASVFGMSFVRSQATAASVNVYRIVKHLSEIAPGKYDALFERLKDIQAQIAAVLDRQPQTAATELVLPLEAVDRAHADQVGSKMANLGDIMARVGLPVPPGFAVTALAYSRFMRDTGLGDEINRLIQAVGADDHATLLPLCSQIQQMIQNAKLPPDVAEAILKAYLELEARTEPDVRVSMRSSALGEDAMGQSFAGQFRSVLGVSAEELLIAYKEIVASKYSPQAVTYRMAKGIPNEDVAMCVGCMAMVKARSGGVIYSRNPLSIRDDEIFIHSAWGLAKTVVDGAVASDLFVARRGDPPRLTEQRIACKDRVYLCDPVEGVCRHEEAGEAACAPSLTDEEALRLASMAIRLDEVYAEPLDIEWAMDQERNIFLLQCRPLQQIEAGRAKRPPGQFGKPLAAGGVTGSPGVAAGTVHVVARDLDMLTFPEGGVVLAADAAPRWATLLSRASALVCERGSVAGHLSNVAREFGVPALMGMEGAVAALSGKGEVTVDADGLAVYPGRVESLLALAPKRETPQAQSPMHAILREVLDIVAPLNLLDPSVPEFSPENCLTLHDITRFCHEKSVTEMFRFGQDFQFSKRASKQLKYRVPMKWWFVNLDDGFTREITGKYVTMEEIACEPVLSLWEGFVAVPWAGPPPVDAAGLLHIVAHSTVNRNLTHGGDSEYAQGNYFMISRHYMCLSSRFGYHFCTVEALVDEREHENYVSFQFKGGAAEQGRRALRAKFVGEVLENYNFRVEIQGDEMRAVYAKGPMDLMLDRLRVIGYLLMHTRQIDMVMTNEAMVEGFRQKFAKDIGDILRQAAERHMTEVMREMA